MAVGPALAVEWRQSIATVMIPVSQELYAICRRAYNWILLLVCCGVVWWGADFASFFRKNVEIMAGLSIMQNIFTSSAQSDNQESGVRCQVSAVGCGRVVSGGW